MYNIRKKYVVFRFFISVRKLYKIVIKIIKSKMYRCVVSDGPVLLTDISQTYMEVLQQLHLSSV